MGKSVVLGVTGGIAAYKSADLVSRLVKAGVDAYCIMTEHAQHFITAQTLESLSQHPVVTDMFRRDTPWEVEHIALAKRADVFAVVPATANVIGKMAHGIADDMLTTTLMATRAPIVLAPAMNTFMWSHPATQANMETLRQRGCVWVGPDSGRLACGDVGAGKMADPQEIFEVIMAKLNPVSDYAGKTVLVTAGPTREAIDPVRFITNRSSGKMGYAIAEAAARRGARVILVSGPTGLAAPAGVERVDVETTAQMMEAVLQVFDRCDAAIMAAAPADYRSQTVSTQKIKKANGGPMALTLVENEDIAAAVGQRKRRDQLLVTFAAETENLLENAAKKIKKKNSDLIVANDVTQPGAGFDVDTNVITLITAAGEQTALPRMAKTEAADHILNKMNTLS